MLTNNTIFGGVWLNLQSPYASSKALGIDHFVRNYLGTKNAPRPFAGRTAEIAKLDSWLSDPGAASNLLLVAPAGRGKSMLLVQWLAGLQRDQVDVIFVPISLRYETNRPAVFFEALATQLAELAGKPLPPPLHNPAEYYKDAAAALLHEMPLADRRCLIVIDGLDEATGGQIDTTLLPDNATPGRRIILSARLTAQRDAARWCEDIGWRQSSREVRIMEIPALDPPKVAEILAANGIARDGNLPDLAGSVAHITEGDPLLVQLYAEDLARGAAEGRSPDANLLHQVRPGYGAYFRNALKQQRLAWKDGHFPPDDHIKALLALLAVAKGPLSHDALAQLAAQILDRSARTDDDVIAFIDRFILRSDSGYSLFHPKLAAFLREEYLVNGGWVLAAQRAFVAWGQITLANLRDAAAPTPGSPYLLQFLSSHLEESDTPADCVQLLDKSWLSAWRTFEKGGFEGLTDDVARVEAVITRLGNALPDHFGHLFHARLILCSANNVGASLDEELLSWGVDNGMVSPRQALRWIRDRSDEAGLDLLERIYAKVPDSSIHEALAAALSVNLLDRPKFLAALLPRLAEDQSGEVIAQLIESAKEAGELSAMLRKLGQHVPADHSGAVVDAARAEGFRGLVLDVLLGFAGRIEEGQESFAFIDDLLAPPQNRVLAAKLIKVLCELRKRAAGPLRQAVDAILPQTLLAADKHAFGSAIALLGGDVPSDWVPALLKKARSEGLSDCELWLSPHLPPSRCLTVLMRSLHWATPEAAQERAVGQLTEDMQRKYLAAVLAVEEPDRRTHLLAAASRAIRFDLRPMLTDLIQQRRGGGEDQTLSTLLRIAGVLSEDLFPLVLESIRRIENAADRASIAAEFIPHAPEALRGRFIEEVEAGLDSISMEWVQGLLLARIGPSVPEPRREAVMRRAVQQADAGGASMRQEVVSTALRVCPALGAETFEAAFRIDDLEKRIGLLLEIAKQLSGGARIAAIRAAADATQSAAARHMRADRLVEVAVAAASMGEAGYTEAARRAIEAVPMQGTCGWLRAKLAPALPLSEIVEMVERDDLLPSDRRAELLATTIFSHVGAAATRAIGLRILQHALDSAVDNDLEPIAETITHLAPLLFDEDKARLLDELSRLGWEVNVAKCLRAISPFLAPHLHAEAFDLAGGIEDREQRIEALRALAEVASAEVAGPFLNQEVDDALRISQSGERAAAFRLLLPALDNENVAIAFRQIVVHIGANVGLLEWHDLLFDVIAQLPDYLTDEALDLARANRRIPICLAAMCRIALRRGQGERLALLEEITRTDKWQQVLRGHASIAPLIGDLPAHRQDQLVSSLASAAHKGSRSAILGHLIDHLPPDSHAKLLGVLDEVRDPRERAECAGILATRVPALAEGSARTFGRAVAEVENARARMFLIQTYAAVSFAPWREMLVRAYLDALPKAPREGAMTTATALLPLFHEQGGEATLDVIGHAVANAGSWLP